MILTLLGRLEDDPRCRFQGVQQGVQKCFKNHAEIENFGFEDASRRRYPLVFENKTGIVIFNLWGRLEDDPRCRCQGVHKCLNKLSQQRTPTATKSIGTPLEILTFLDRTPIRLSKSIEIP